MRTIVRPESGTPSSRSLTTSLSTPSSTPSSSSGAGSSSRQLRRSSLRRLLLTASIVAPLSTAIAHDMHDMHDMHEVHEIPKALLAPPPVFVASTAKPFAGLMDDAMAVMDQGVQQAPMNGHAEHDFVTMMMPHHQGAVNMARAVLLYSQDPEIRNLALGIIAEQQSEIQVMQAWLKQQGYPLAAV